MRRRPGTTPRYLWLTAIKEKKIKIVLPWRRIDKPAWRVTLIKYARIIYERHADFNVHAEVFRQRRTSRWHYVVGYRNHSSLAMYRGYCYSKKNALEKADKFLAKHNIRVLDEKGLARIKLFT